MARQAILLHSRDDVATALNDLKQGQSVHAGLDDRSVDVVLRDDIPFGHKYALHDIPSGAPVLKYGLPIGNALEEIHAGQWVHVHNCRSDRFGHRHEKYGVNA